MHRHLWIAALAWLGCQRDRPVALRPPPGPPRATVEIHAPDRLVGVAAPVDDHAPGAPARVACATCHSQRTPARLPSSTAELREFHQGLTFAHGPLACGSCHLIGDQRSLHLADGARIDMREALLLCRQCHGPQARDYDHGSHGGMTGHWDLSVGGRTRNHCVDCHDPHVPAFQPSRPVLPPRDLGLVRHPREGKHE